MWQQAEAFCRQFNGHLASIADAAENDFVHHLRKSLIANRSIKVQKCKRMLLLENNIWIGLNKVAKSDFVQGRRQKTRVRDCFFR